MIVPVAAWAAKPSVSDRVGCGWIVSARSSASAPISIAWAASAISSPAFTPTAPAPRIRRLSGSTSSLVRPSARPHPERAPRGRPREGRHLVGHLPLLRLGLGEPGPGDLRGRCRRRSGSSAGRTPRPPATASAATWPWWLARWASIGSPVTSPIAWMWGTLVRSCSSTAITPRSSTATPAASAPMRSPFARRPTATRTPVEGLLARRALALEAPPAARRRRPPPTRPSPPGGPPAYRSRMRRCSGRTRSGSTPAIRRSSISTTVTREPSASKTVAISRPMMPAADDQQPLGHDRRARARAVESITRGSSAQGRGCGRLGTHGDDARSRRSPRRPQAPRPPGCSGR